MKLRWKKSFASENLNIEKVTSVLSRNNFQMPAGGCLSGMHFSGDHSLWKCCSACDGSSSSANQLMCLTSGQSVQYQNQSGTQSQKGQGAERKRKKANKKLAN